jgi:uncharacterized protein
MGMPLGIGGTILALVLSLIFGGDVFDGGTTTVESQGALAPADSAREEPMVEFVSFVLDDAQQVWSRIFQEQGTPYQDAKLVLFRNGVQSGCGNAQSAMGPFYCPQDQRVYLDLGFFEDLDSRFGAPGDFAQAYVLAHELGHHVQYLLGTEASVRRAQQENPRNANALSVAMELQADCYAGVWAHAASARARLEPGDAEEGIAAAGAVGDDRLQKAATGSVRPESFTHGSSSQRVSWFRRGFETGRPESCDTF